MIKLQVQFIASGQCIKGRDYTATSMIPPAASSRLQKPEALPVACQFLSNATPAAVLLQLEVVNEFYSGSCHAFQVQVPKTTKSSTKQLEPA